MKLFHKYIIWILFFAGFANVTFAQTNSKSNDSIAVKNDSLGLTYNFKHSQTGNMLLNYPSKIEVIFDKVLNKYVFVEKVGDYYIKTPIYMTPEEYEKYRLRRDMLDYFKSKVAAEKSKNSSDKKDLLPTYYVNSKFFETIFGSNEIKITPTGNINLKLGFIYQNTENPQLSEQNRSSFTFDFDQQINAGIQAQVGNRLKFTAQYDTQSTFDFQNIIKVEFIPPSLSDVKYGEDGIIQGIEAGNISMPIKNSLINGAQSLFGLKTKLQFGKTNITAVFSQQNSESTTVTAEGGASIQEFELRATDYDNDRHFFLSQYFRENFSKSLQNYPLISSPINITRIELWITNRNASVEDFRSIVALADIAEPNSENFVSLDGLVIPALTAPSVNGVTLPSNESNNISEALSGPQIRDIATVDNYLSGTYGMSQGSDYSLLQNARKLQPNEYTLNSQLGFVSLNRRLNDGEVLAVSYEYTVVGASNGKTSFKVGEFSNDGISSPENLAVKLLRSEILTTKRTIAGVEEAFPTWKLMMKNIYALGASPLTPDGFRFEIQYRDDQTGVSSNTLQNAQSVDISTKPLLQVFNLDRLDQTQYQTPDGYFDYVEGITINSQKGYVIFPEAEPFGDDLESSLDVQSDVDLYVFDELYLDTKINVKNNNQNKDKFLLKGYFKSEDSGGIPLNAYNVPRGSVTVTAGGRQLVEGIDYVVDYLAGRVQILDPGLQSSGIPINVSTENNAVFNQQRKTFMGVDVEHNFNENFILGATILNVNERPLTPKVNFGGEPINNTMLGMNLDFSTEMPLFTKLANKLPFVDTDVPSNLSVRADMAYLIPGSPKGIDVVGSATSYIDDFEASQIPISLLTPLQWYTSSTPDTPAFPEFNGNLSNDKRYNYKRARLAWYTIDPIFYGAGDTPVNIDADALSRAETRQINYDELFPNQELDVTQQSLIRTLDLAYFPSERGPYNFEQPADISNPSRLENPEDRWAGIMRPLTTNNFEQANVEYIQFWVMDPYINYSITNSEGLPSGINPQDLQNQVGDLYINLGNISEDILKDNRKMYENGLPEDELSTNTTETIWGKVPTNPSIIYAFNEEDNSRIIQDLGLDGLNDTEEREKYPELASLDDPASDNFKYYRGGDLDDLDASIISRYKFFNNTQGNSPTLNQSPESYPTSSSTYPDVEDINKDQTMNTVESYFEYKVSLNSSDLIVGQNYIVDQKDTQVTLDNGESQTAKWYQFRIPVRSGSPINNISDFNSIRFIRMFMTNFKMPVVLRFGELDLVRGDWRRYTRTLDPAIAPDQPLEQQELNDFEVGVVNIEQNEGRYVLPPGIERERLQGSTTVQQQNEQSVTLKVNNLPQNKIRAIYKNISVDLRRYKELKMFIHAESIIINGVDDDDLTAIVRLGTDLNDNFYQLEIPLKISTYGSLAPLDVWPEANNLDAMLEQLGKIKLARDAANAPINELFTSTNIDFGDLVLRVKGNPTLAQIRTIMLGVRNNNPLEKSAEIWFNELRSAGFDNDGGWAAVVNADANFADVASLSMTGRMQTVGFGNVEDRVSQRSLDETKEYDISTSINIGKMMPKKWGIELPMNYSVGEQFIDPKFDPQYQDIELADVEAANLPSSIPRGTDVSRNYTKRSSISFINVRKNRNPESSKKPKFYDVENVSVSYSFNEESHRDYNIEGALSQKVMAAASYNFTFKPKFYEPFKKKELFKSKYLQLIRDINFNPLPSSLAINSRINRNFNEQRSRNLVEGLSAQPTLKQRRFLFDWDYAVAFNFTKSLAVNFNATNSFIYDAFGSGDDIEIFNNFFNVGRPTQYNQKLNTTYKLPINKIPYLGFMSLDYAYTADFDWKATSQDASIIERVGNLIQNANTHNVTGSLNFAKLYKDTKFENLFLKKKNRKKPNPNSLDKSTTNKQVSARKRKKEPLGRKLIRGFYDVITSVKTGKISYSENNGQLLPGYAPEVGFLGRNNFGGGQAPSLGFVFGSQVDIRNTALVNGWLVAPRLNGEDYYDKTYTRTHFDKLDYNFSLKPAKDLNIEITGNKINTRSLAQQLDIRFDSTDPEGNGFIDESIPAFITGNFSTSYSMFSTAFKNGDQLFDQLRANRIAISRRLGEQVGIDVDDPANINPLDGTVVGFGTNSQDVLLPSFLAAYSGKNANKVKLGIFRDIPIPAWNLRYTGFMKYKWFKENFSSFSVTHGYKSSYTVSSFTNNLQYDDDNPTITNAAGDFESRILVSSATLVDEFSPLIRVDMKMKNSFSMRGELKRDRTLTMNFNNSTLTDIKGTEYIFGFGYVFKDVKMKTSFTGKKQTLKGDINLRADVSLRDNLTLIRSVNSENDQISGGQKLFSIKFTADYRLNSNLTTSFYYNHQTSRYAISTTFPRQSINAGFNFIYNLGGNK
ncbi:cell surface protein SprA [Flavobacteriaceae bacterium]|nr:cell surface protein SprA [Flavobacteriaceae bacterium]MDB2684731.1 cell surface protein SprA [Flavobacteriaceae bacterium]MDC0636695.1 cell surface protein SprA [Flavobacteriaceae bacterium]